MFLLHGRDSNSAIAWGAVNDIFYDNSEFENRQFCPNVNATTENNNKSYTSVTSQRIASQTTNLVSGDSIIQDYTLPGVFDGKFDKGNYSNVPHPEGANLAYMLSNCGYTENINLFVFNYPSIDAIMHSAKKFEKYIENLIEYIRESNRDSMKTCFYTSRQAYDNNYFTFNIVAHSMGGLVSRYYIENLDQDKRVDKLITICTPHWGSRYANLSNNTSIKHCLCDHDLDTGSAMFGNDTGSVLSNGCSLWDIVESYDCTTTSYYITDALQYSKERHTKYYAIAGIDYNATTFDENDHMLSLPTTFTTFEEIEDFMENEQIYKQLVLKSHIDIKKVGDNTVRLLSQIGWTDDDQETPTKRINMEKIVIDVDTNGGNGGEIFIWEMINDFGEHILHSKIPHREAVCQKVIEFLGECYEKIHCYKSIL